MRGYVMPRRLNHTSAFLQSYKKALLTGVVSISLTALSAGQSFAEEENKSDTNTVLKPVIVSGEKISRSLQRTAGSVTVISAEDLANKPTASTIVDALQGTPNVLYTNTTDAPIIRGVDTKGPLVKGNAFLANPVPRATMSMDGRYLTASELGLGSATVWDVKSIEVFRGPQTTTQGANAIAGAVVINTNDPTFTPEVIGQVMYGSRNAKRTSFVANGPLSDQLAARVAIDYSGRDTFIKYDNPNFMDYGMNHDPDNLTGRVKFLLQPDAIPGLEAKLTLSHLDVKRPAFEAASKPYDDFKDRSPSTDNSETKTDSGIFDLSYDLGNNIKLTNQFQYSEGKYDYNFGKSFNGTASKNYSNISNESRVNFGDEESTWSGVAGLYYSYNKSNNDLHHDFASTDFLVNQRSVGVFSEVTYRFAERWALTGGLRYQYDKMGHDGDASYVPGVHYTYDESFDDVLPKISLSYDLTDDVTVGVLASKGYLPGGTGLNFSGKRYYTFDKETAWNYELFSRANVLDTRMSITTNIFYTKYSDAQRSVTDYLNGRPFGSIIVNSDEAESYGAELGLEYQVLDNVGLRGGLGLLHTETSSFGDYRGEVFNGKKFAKAPGYMFNVGADWNITSQFKLSGDVRHTDDYFSTDDNDPALRVGAFTVANMHLSYNPTENFEIFAYANNIFDERVPVEKYSDRATGGIQAYMLQPREFGVGMKAKF